MKKQFYVAPLQGFTDSFWRKAHADVMRAEGVDPVYFSPFIRVEKGDVRRRDLRDIEPARNASVDIVPQAIFRDLDELVLIANAVVERGYSRLDLNMGCPFPPQVKSGRGAGALRREIWDALPVFISSRPELRFSIKMRLGVKDAFEWREFEQQINTVDVDFITIHPRVAAQQYKGEPNMDEFARFIDAVRVPIVYNGDVRTPEDYNLIASSFPSLKGIMVGRGVLARPSLPVEVEHSVEWSDERRRTLWLKISREVGIMVGDDSQGEAQALMRLKPRLEYAEEAIVERKLLKALGKCRTFEQYINLLK